LTVYFIGAGPGDPELLTLKAKKIIEEADTIIYAGSLVNLQVLKFAKAGAALYDSSRMVLEEVFQILREAKRDGRVVVRIHTGDPAVYGAIQEQLDWCEKKGIKTEVIPGISSYQAAAASLKQELTLPGVSQTLILTRLSGRTKVPAREALKNLARAKATMVIFLSVHEIDRVVEELRLGYPLDTPVAVIEKASWKEERKIVGILQDIADKVREAGMKRHALIIVGDVLRKRYRKSKLYDRNFEHGFRKRKA
jgi:precorrin-4/cobalt-precorrin-4 C11-methyltransferase